MSEAETVKKLVEWWTRSNETRWSYDEHWFTEDFVFDSGIETLNRDELRWYVENGIPVSETQVLGVVAVDEDAAIFFEGTDNVTNLRHRFAWMVQFRGGAIWRIIATNAIVSTPAAVHGARP